MWFDSASVLRVGLATDHLVAARGPRRGPRDMAAGHMQAWNATHGAGPWNDAVRALSEQLASKPSGVRRVDVVLSNRLVRWQLLSLPAQLASVSELQAFARAHFESVYGKRAENWLCHASFFAPGKAVPVCAVENALVPALQAVCTEHGVQLASVRPYWSQAFNYWRSALRDDIYWLAQIEPDMLTLGLVQERQWLGLRSIRTGNDLHESLRSLQAQMSLARDTPTNTLNEATPIYVMGSHAALDMHLNHPFHVLRPVNSVFKSAPQWRLAWGI